MSSVSTGVAEDGNQRRPLGPMSTPVGMDYTPTEDERRIFRECSQESFMYRSLPFSFVAMAITQALMAKGVLSPSPRFGPLPKVAFAGFFGYVAGKLSYMKTCQEKFKRLENSPLGEALRQRTVLPHSQGPQSEMTDPNTESFDPMFQAAESTSQTANISRDFEQGYSADSAQQTDRDPDEPRRKAILYEDLRSKNRENYEVMLTQKSETLNKPPPEREPVRPAANKDAKKNIYGDTWEE